MKLKLDENLGRRVAEVFRAAGHDDDLMRASRTLLAGLEQIDITGKLWVIQPGRLREYSPASEEDE